MVPPRASRATSAPEPSRCWRAAATAAFESTIFLSPPTLLSFAVFAASAALVAAASAASLAFFKASLLASLSSASFALAAASVAVLSAVSASVAAFTNAGRALTAANRAASASASAFTWAAAGTRALPTILIGPADRGASSADFSTSIAELTVEPMLAPLLVTPGGSPSAVTRMSPVKPSRR